MKRIKNILIILMLFSMFVLMACNVNSISLNGAVELNLEIGTKYVDEGVRIPDGYTYKVEGYFNENYLGKYELVYYIYSDTGESVKELHRFINVVDTQAPRVIAYEENVYGVGVQYEINDFIEDYNDNYDAQYYINVEAISPLKYDDPGKHEIVIKFTDTSGNINEFKREFEFTDDQSAVITKGCKLKGDAVVNVEVKTNYKEEGVIIPEGYTYIPSKSYISTNSVGSFDIQYSIYDENGQLVTILKRTVNVVDTQAPEVEDNDITEYAVGIEYKATDFFESYSDNCDYTFKITVTPVTPLIFYKEGKQTIEIDVSDSSGNTTKFTKEIEAVYDIDVLKETCKASGKYNQTIMSTGKYVNIRINDRESVSYFETDSLHYSFRIDSNLGSYASISISAKPSSIDKASINLHISEGDTYSAMTVRIDASKEYDSFFFNKNTMFINNLDLNDLDMYKEIEKYAQELLNGFKIYLDYNWADIFDD